MLSRLYRRLFLEKLVAAHHDVKLRFSGTLAHLVDLANFQSVLAPLRRIEWLDYAKRPFAGPEQVLTYLARYTHRVAISNRRLLAIAETHVTIAWRDYRDGARTKQMRLGADELMRRFLLHVLPDGFQRIRHYGMLASGHRRAKLALIRKLLDVTPAVPNGSDSVDDTAGVEAEPLAPPPCPCCGGRMLIVAILPDPREQRVHHRLRRLDSS